jgi:peroxiredoxin
MEAVGPGDPAAAAELPCLGGGTVELPGGAPLTLLVFYKASCPTCRWALPFVQALHERAHGLTVVGIASEDDVDEAAAFAAELGLTFPIGLESAPWEVSAAYGLTTVPTLFLIDGAGRVKRVSPGFAKEDFLAAAAEAAALHGGAPADPFPEGAAVPEFRPG